MEANSVTDLDQQEDEDWEISLFNSSRLPTSGRNLVLEEEEEEEEDDDDDGEFDYDYDGNAELGCPYCGENFDILGLCCHIDDQHYKDAKSGICPICDKALDTNMTVHIIAEHERLLRALRTHRKVKVRSGETDTGLSRLKIDDHFCHHLKEPSPVGSPELSPDPSFLSFIRTPMPAYRPESLQPKSPREASSSSTTSNCDPVERYLQKFQSIEPSSLTDKCQDKVQVSEFISDLLFSTIFNDL